MTKDEFDAAVEEKAGKVVEDKIKNLKLQEEFKSIHEEAQRNAERKGYQEEKPEIKLGKLVHSFAKARGNVDEMLKVVKTAYPEDKETSGYVEKTLSAGNPSTGGFGIPAILSQKVIEALYANSILAKVGGQRIPLAAGNVSLTKMSTSASVGWVDELPSEGLTTPVFGNVKLSAKKLFALAEISNSLLRYETVGIEGWLARDLQRKFSIALDYAMLYGAGTSYTPAGLTKLGVSTAGGTNTALDQTKPDELITLVKEQNIPMTNCAFICHPRMESWLKNLKTTTGAWIFREEIVKDKTLCGYPLIVSTSSSYTDTTTDYADLWFGDFDEFLHGVGLDLELRMSTEASYVASSTTYSAFQRDSALVRVVGEHDFNVMHKEGFVQGTYSVS